MSDRTASERVKRYRWRQVTGGLLAYVEIPPSFAQVMIQSGYMSGEASTESPDKKWERGQALLKFARDKSKKL